MKDKRPLSPLGHGFQGRSGSARVLHRTTVLLSPLDTAKSSLSWISPGRTTYCSATFSLCAWQDYYPPKSIGSHDRVSVGSLASTCAPMKFDELYHLVLCTWPARSQIHLEYLRVCAHWSPGLLWFFRPWLHDVWSSGLRLMSQQLYCAIAYRVRLGICVYMNKYVATLNSVVRCAILLDIPIQRYNSQPHHW